MIVSLSYARGRGKGHAMKEELLDKASHVSAKLDELRGYL
jgi:hypothetical protein